MRERRFFGYDSIYIGIVSLEFFRVCKRCFVVWMIVALLAPLISARAQSGGGGLAEIEKPDVSAFPVISTYMDPFDDQGNFLANLKSGDVVVLENGELIVPDSLVGQVTPMSFVLAINSDPALGIRDAQGDARYEKILAALTNWAEERPADSQDRLGLVWNGGMIANKLTPADWKARLESFDPALRTSTSGLSALTFALDVALDVPVGPGVKKAVLLVSPHLASKDLKGLDDLISRAKQSGVRVYVWITDANTFVDNAGTLALQDLAAATNGRDVFFSGGETLPDPEEWLAPLRNVYKLSYTSKVRTAGTHTLSVQVNKDKLTLTSPAVTFAIDIQAPSVALLSPPIEIMRQNAKTPFDVSTFLPKQQEISLLVEFPDGRERRLVRSTLFIDGEKASEHIREPFTSFSWDLSGYQVSGEHTLQVEVEDDLGLMQKSSEVPVVVTIVEPPGGMAGLILRNRTAVTISFMVLAAGVLLGVIILGGRRGLTRLAEWRKSRAAKSDPLTQPVKSIVEAPRNPKGNPFPWLLRRDAPPPAYFVRLAGDGTPMKGDPIGLHGRELTLGTDPTQATVILDHPAISALHARVRRGEDDKFTLLDQNSIAGTWVNYELVPPKGRVLKHGDMIHFGVLVYRFVLAKPPVALKPKVTTLHKEK